MQQVTRTKPFDIMRLPTQGRLYPSKTKTLEIERLNGYHEDILNSTELIRTNKVWETMYDLTVRNKNELAFEQLFFVDLLMFMIHTRKTAYGSVYEQMEMTSSGELDSFEIDLDNINFIEPEGISMDEYGLFSFTLPSSNKLVKFKVLNNKEEGELEENTKKEAMMMNLKFIPKITRRLEATIKSIDGNEDRMYIRNFLEGADFTNLDSMKLREYQNKVLPIVNMNVESVGKRTKEKKMIQIKPSMSFFFPAYGL